MSITKQELYDRVSDRVELKSLDVARNLSEETLAFTATIYVDGDVAGRAKNRGRGGATMLTAFVDRRGGGDPTRKENIDALRDIASDLPEVETRYGTMEYTAEALVDFLATWEDVMRDARRYTKNGKGVFRPAEQTAPDFRYGDLHGESLSAFLIAIDRSNPDMEITHAFKDGEWKRVSEISEDGVTYR